MVHMWEQVKWAIVESKRSVRLSESRRKEPKECVMWNDEVKAVVKIKEAAWKLKVVLGARNEQAKMSGSL